MNLFVQSVNRNQKPSIMSSFIAVIMYNVFGKTSEYYFYSMTKDFFHLTLQDVSDRNTICKIPFTELFVAYC